jgi:hypothetical protein
LSTASYGFANTGTNPEAVDMNQTVASCPSREPFGLLTLAAPKCKPNVKYLGGITMRRTLVSTILAGLVVSAFAHPKTTPPALDPDAVSRVTLQKPNEAVKVRAMQERPSPTIKESTSSV